jgi:small subunit ribosomal protein S16
LSVSELSRAKELIDMAVKIRLRRSGKVNEPCHRIVVADVRSPRDGRFIENIGVYDPRHKTERVDLQRAEYWLGCGAQASETVAAIIKRARAGVPMSAKPVAPKTTDSATETPAPAAAPAVAPAPAEA